jgi:hypothetical protein
VSHVTHQDHPGPDALLAMAARLACEWGEDVLVVWEPAAKTDCQPHIPYVVRASAADAHERQTGQRVSWKEE